MILLDTHILVWLLIAPENLSPKAKKAILAARKPGAACSLCNQPLGNAWLAVNKRIDLDVRVDSFVEKCASYVQVLPSTPEIAVLSVQFPKSYPNNPQDRIIGATAIVEGIRLLTHDKMIVKSGLVLWQRSAQDSGGDIDAGAPSTKIEWEFRRNIGNHFFAPW